MSYKIISGNLQDETELWKYMDVSKFLSLLSTSELWLARSNTLKDKREGSFPKEIKDGLKKMYEAMDPKGEISNSSVKSASDYELYVKNNAYFTCWHKNTDDNMIMWEIYGKSENSVAIKTNSSKLKNAFNFENVMKFSLEVALDEIEYIKSDSITSIQNSRRPFFIKRPHFYFEAEVRLYIRARAHHSTENAPAGYKIPVDLNVLIEEIYVHPDAEEWFFNAVVDLVKKYDISSPVSYGMCGNQF